MRRTSGSPQDGPPTRHNPLNRRFTEMTLMQINTVHWESMPRREREKAVENPLERKPMVT